MPIKIYNDKRSHKDVAAFVDPSRNRTQPTRRKLAAFVNSSMDKCSSKFGAAIKRVAGLVPVKKSKSKAKAGSQESQSTQGGPPVPDGVANASEPILSPSEASPASSLSGEVEADQDEGALRESASALSQLVNAFHLDDDLEADEPDLGKPEPISVEEYPWSAPGVPIAFASGRYAAFPWPSPVSVSCFNHQRLGSVRCVGAAEYDPVSNAVDNFDARIVPTQDSNSGRVGKTSTPDVQVSFFSRRPLRSVVPILHLVRFSSRGTISSL